MNDGSESDLTPKARQTRERILTTALELFAEKGYSETTLRQIAAKAEISLGLTYRYFARKEELIMALYERLSAECAEEAKTLPRGTIAARFGRAISSSLDRLQPHRDALGSLFAVGLAPESEMAVLGERAAGVRTVTWGVYADVVRGASDSATGKQADQIATLLYAGHMLIVLFWLQDRSPGQRTTGDLVKFAEDILKRLRPLLRVPGVSGPVAKLSRLLGPMFGPAVAPAAGGPQSS